VITFRPHIQGSDVTSRVAGKSFTASQTMFLLP